MSHGIIKPFDVIFSTESTEWHGMAEKVNAITAEVAKPLFFPIVEGQISVALEEMTVEMKNHKALVADCRHRPEMVAAGMSLVPLHIPRQTYRPINNREVWDAMEAGLSEIDAKITSVGTLECGKKFFISADIGGSFKIKNGQAKENFLANLNFITSHDGTLGVRAYDSVVRIVCMNTLRASLKAQGEVGFNVYHTEKADVAMQKLPELVNAVLLGRKELAKAMAELTEIQMTEKTAKNIVAGYFAQTTGQEKLVTRSRNATESIVNLFKNGRGNSGQTAYDLLNGATEYWTSGEGTGKKSDDISRLYKANFGAAAEHKEEFSDMLFSPDRRQQACEVGELALAH